jgi:hypothetical protein
MLRAHVPFADRPPPAGPRTPGGTAMIVVVALDPAVHVSYEAERIVPGTTHPVGPLPGRRPGPGGGPDAAPVRP